jgi:hypothetical protein
VRRVACLIALAGLVVLPTAAAEPPANDSQASAALLATLSAADGSYGSGANSPRLEIMVLPASRLGTSAHGLDVSIGSGFTDNIDAAEDTIDPKDTAASLARAGRMNGYELAYEDLSALPFVRGKGLLQIASSVDRFRSAAAADAFIDKQLEDYARFRGKVVEGARLVEFDRFAVPRLGERSLGLRGVVELGSKRVPSTSVIFRAGPLVGDITIDRADSKPVNQEAIRFARALASRMRLALAGKLKENPVQVPPVGEKGRAPEGGPDMAAMALTVADLPKGMRLGRQAYVRDHEALASYEREFSTAEGQNLEHDLSLFRSAREAGGFALVIREMFLSPTFKTMFSGLFGKDARSLKIESQKPLPVGDEGFALSARVSTGGVSMRMIWIFTRVDRIFATQIAVGSPSSLRLSTVKPLADKFVSRIRAGL